MGSGFAAPVSHPAVNAEQQRAQQMGITGIITKPIDLDDLKMKVSRALNLDTSYKYFFRENTILVLKLPAALTNIVANDISLNLRPKITEAVDAGIEKIIFDMSQILSADILLIKLVISALSLCHELDIKSILIGSEAVRTECKNYEETKDWQFVSSFEEAGALLNGKTAPVA